MSRVSKVSNDEEDETLGPIYEVGVLVFDLGRKCGERVPICDISPYPCVRDSSGGRINDCWLCGRIKDCWLFQFESSDTSETIGVFRNMISLSSG